MTFPVAATPAAPPAAFADAAAALRALAERGRVGEVALFESAAPTRVAPHGLSLGAELVGDLPPAEPGEEDAAPDPLASGRFVVLHDPAGQPGWDGHTRVVAFVRADVEPDMARDPLLAEVVWLWLREALESRGAQAHAEGGTVTVTSSRRFGALAAEDDPASAPPGTPETCEVELRCSWTPTPGTETLAATLTAHLGAFCDLLATAAGRPPLAAGVVALRPR